MLTYKITMTHIYRKQIIQVFQRGGHVFLTCDTVNHYTYYVVANENNTNKCWFYVASYDVVSFGKVACRLIYYTHGEKLLGKPKSSKVHFVPKKTYENQ